MERSILRAPDQAPKLVHMEYLQPFAEWHIIVLVTQVLFEQRRCGPEKSMDNEQKPERDSTEEILVQATPGPEVAAIPEIQPEVVLEPNVAISNRVERLLADVKVNTTVRRLINRAEMLLDDVKVSASRRMENSRQAPAEKPTHTGNSIVILTANENLNRLFELLEKSAAEAAPGDISAHDLNDAAQQVLSSDSKLDAETAGRMRQILNEDDESRPASLPGPLTARQIDVLKLLAQGKTNRDIAQELILSTGTVRTHVQRIIARLGASDRTGAVVRAIELGLIAPKFRA